MLMGVTGRVRRLCGQRKSRLRTESIIVATSRSKPGATPILRPDDHAVDALPFAHIWRTSHPTAAGRPAIPAQFRAAGGNPARSPNGTPGYGLEVGPGARSRSSR